MLTNCFCGIAQTHISYCALHALRQREVDKLLVWDRPDACLVMCVTRFEAMSGRRIASIVAPRRMLCSNCTSTKAMSG